MVVRSAVDDGRQGSKKRKKEIFTATRVFQTRDLLLLLIHHLHRFLHVHYVIEITLTRSLIQVFLDAITGDI